MRSKGVGCEPVLCRMFGRVVHHLAKWMLRSKRCWMRTCTVLNVCQGGTSLGEADAEIQGVLDVNLYSVECL